ncbi:hypothetical protein SynA1528_00413 [Synechococcus sp. A15-28]|nr:hypothetical protein SynA1528_00413 [Synechococcus sp. A15-28]
MSQEFRAGSCDYAGFSTIGFVGSSLSFAVSDYTSIKV